MSRKFVAMPWTFGIIASATSAFGIGNFGIRTGMCLLAEDRVDAELGQAGFEDLGVAPAVEDEHLAGDPVLGRQAVGGNGLGPVGKRPTPARLLVLAGPAGVVKAVRVLVVAHDVTPGGPRGELEVEVLLGEGVEIVGHGPNLRCGAPGMLERC